MADPKKPRDRSADVERLAAQIYAPLVASAAQRGKTPEGVAAEALRAAVAFYAVLDTTPEAKG